MDTLPRTRPMASVFFGCALLLAGTTSVRAQSSDPFIDVKAFGALGDGKTDDTANIQKALTYAAGLKTQPEVFFPAGTYIISQTLTIGSPMRLVGTSADITGGSSIRTTSATADVIFLDVGAAGSAIEGLSIRSTQFSQTAGAGIRVNFTTSNNGTGMTPLRIENVFVSNMYDGIWIQAANNVYLSDLLIAAVAHDGLRLGVTGSSSHVLDVYLRSSIMSALKTANADVDITNSDGVELNNVQTYQGGYGFLIANSRQLFFQGVIADSPILDAYAINNSMDLNFVNSWAAGSATGHGVSLLTVNNFSWMGGFIRENYASGIFVQSGVQNLSVSTAALSSNGLNNTTQTDTYGIYIDQPMTNLRVVNNVFGDVGEDAGVVKQTYALYFNTAASATANTAVIQGNQDFHDTFSNAYTSPWFLAGNPGQLSWSVGSGAPSGTCNSGSLYSALVNGGSLYVCVNATWHTVSLAN
jgi:hypothetical protein